MTSSDYDESWNIITDEALINRIKLAFTGTDPENRFEPYDFYVTGNTFDNGSHYIIRVYAGQNGSGNWNSYMQDMKLIFDNLTNNICNFKDAWLIEWKNSCGNDTSVALIGIDDW